MERLTGVAARFPCWCGRVEFSVQFRSQLDHRKRVADNSMTLHRSMTVS